MCLFGLTASNEVNIALLIHFVLSLSPVNLVRTNPRVLNKNVGESLSPVNVAGKLVYLSRGAMMVAAVVSEREDASKHSCLSPTSIFHLLIDILLRSHTKKDVSLDSSPFNNEGTSNKSQRYQTKVRPRPRAANASPAGCSIDSQRTKCECVQYVIYTVHIPWIKPPSLSSVLIKGTLPQSWRSVLLLQTSGLQNKGLATSQSQNFTHWLPFRLFKNHQVWVCVCVCDKIIALKAVLYIAISCVCSSYNTTLSYDLQLIIAFPLSRVALRTSISDWRGQVTVSVALNIMIISTWWVIRHLVLAYALFVNLNTVYMYLCVMCLVLCLAAP